MQHFPSSVNLLLNFVESAPITPPPFFPRNDASPYFTIELLPSVTSKHHQQISWTSIISEKSPHTLFFYFKENSFFSLSPKVYAGSIGPDVPPKTELGFQRNYLQKISSFDGHLIFPHSKLPMTIPKKVYEILTATTTPRNKSSRNMNPVFSN